MATIGFKIRGALLIVISAALSTSAQAQVVTPPAATPAIADTPCDTEYFKTLESRAWLEAQREITQNQNLIYKPDSVLAYTCFDQFADVTANMQNWQGFSETSRWGNVITPLTTAMDDALNPLVSPSLISYLTKNFSNTADTATDKEPIGKYLSRRGPNNYKSSGISGGAYNCSEMNTVWQSAKCYNFQTEKIKNSNGDDVVTGEGFFTFEQHSQQDKRLLANACEMTPELQDIWTKQIQNAGLKPGTAPTTWPFDKVKVYYDQLKPEKCTTSTPLPTGVTVTSNTEGLPASWPENICIIPGCYFDPNSQKCAATGG